MKFRHPAPEDPRRTDRVQKLRNAGLIVGATSAGVGAGAGLGALGSHVQELMGQRFSAAMVEGVKHPSLMWRSKPDAPINIAARKLHEKAGRPHVLYPQEVEHLVQRGNGPNLSWPQREIAPEVLRDRQARTNWTPGFQDPQHHIVGSGFSNATLLHELGHSATPKSEVMRFMKAKLDAPGRAIGGSLGSTRITGSHVQSALTAGALAHALSLRDEKKRDNAKMIVGGLATLGMLPHVAVLAEEARASRNALRAIKGLDPSLVRQVKAELLPAYGSYVGIHGVPVALGTVGAGLAAHGAYRRLKRAQERRRTNPK